MIALKCVHCQLQTLCPTRGIQIARSRRLAQYQYASEIVCQQAEERDEGDLRSIQDTDASVFVTRNVLQSFLGSPPPHIPAIYVNERNMLGVSC